MKRAIFCVGSCVAIYVIWWQTRYFYEFVYSFQHVVPNIVVLKVIRFVPLILCITMGITLRQGLIWPFRWLRDRFEERQTSRDLAARYHSARRVMDSTTRRVKR